MTIIEKVLFAFKWLRQGSPPLIAATAWDSMVGAASEEWVDDTHFQFSVELGMGFSFDDLAGEILNRGMVHPDLNELIQIISARFNIGDRQALTAIDRALGGVVRAATLNPKASPDEATDPVAAAAFRIASCDLTFLNAIFPGWREWPSGCHSKHSAPD